jgi:hypothetical protein
MATGKRAGRVRFFLGPFVTLLVRTAVNVGSRGTADIVPSGAPSASVANLGCVKTRKFEKPRKLFFSDHAKANKFTNCRGNN